MPQNTMIKEEILDEIDTILEYLYSDELDDYEESDKPKNHVFASILKVEKWVNKERKNTN
jgi:hypothetical protein